MAWDDRLIPGEMPLTAKIMIAGMEITPAEIARLRRIEAAAKRFVERTNPASDSELRRAVMGWPMESPL